MSFRTLMLVETPNVLPHKHDVWGKVSRVTSPANPPSPRRAAPRRFEQLCTVQNFPASAGLVMPIVAFGASNGRCQFYFVE